MSQDCDDNLIEKEIDNILMSVSYLSFVARNNGFKKIHTILEEAFLKIFSCKTPPESVSQPRDEQTH
jgi:hypothetical protein